MQIKKNKVETPNGKLEYCLSGSGKPNLILINGGSGPIEGWMKILPDLSEISTVFAYNRLGVAGSDKPREAQDGNTIVKNLRELLDKVDIAPPYLLIGHSLGGLYANLFARLFPHEVIGIVFIESSHPKDTNLEQYQGKVVKAINKMLSVVGSFSSSKQWNEVNFVKETVNQINQISTFPEIPIYVITGGKESRMMPKEARQLRLKNQLELVSLSPISQHIIAKKSGHFPQLSEPKLVINTIKVAIEQLKECRK